MSAYQCHEFFTEALKFTRPHAVDAEHLAGGEWRLFRHLDQRRVVEDHVWRGYSLRRRSLYAICAAWQTACGHNCRQRISASPSASAPRYAVRQAAAAPRRAAPVVRLRSATVRSAGRYSASPAQGESVGGSRSPSARDSAPADTVNRQLIVAHVTDALVVGPAQDLHHVTHPETLIHPVNR